MYIYTSLYIRATFNFFIETYISTLAVNMIWIKCIFGLLILMGITCLPAIAHEKNVRIRRSVPGGVPGIMTGAPEPKDPNDPKYLELANLALEKMGEANHDHVVSKVTKVTEQVVAGLLTEIDFDIKPASCQASSPSCSTLNCHSSILEQDWLNKADFTTTCGFV